MTTTTEEEQFADVPLRWRLALTELRKQFYRVVPLHWHEEDLVLSVDIYRDEETVNPNRYELHAAQSGIVRRDMRGGTWPVHKSLQPLRGEVVPIRRKPRRHRRPAAAPVIRNTTLQEAFVKRAEVMDDLDSYELKFIMKPTDANAGMCKALRMRLTEIEDEIVALAEVRGTT